MTEPNAAADDTCSAHGQQQLQHLLEHGLSPAAAQATVDIDRTMMQIRNSMARRSLGRMALRDLGIDIETADLDIISAVEAGPAGDSEVTVGMVAERLSIDPSRASRIVADAVDKGLVRRVASQADARRIGLELTDTGKSHAAAIRAYKWSLFAQTLGEWPEEDLVTFARLFDRFSGWVAEARTKMGGKP